MGIRDDLNNRSQVIKFTWIILIHSENFISRFFISHRTYSFFAAVRRNTHNGSKSSKRVGRRKAWTKYQKNNMTILIRALSLSLCVLFSWINRIKFIGFKHASQCASYAAYCVYVSVREHLFAFEFKLCRFAHFYWNLSNTCCELWLSFCYSLFSFFFL